MSYWVVITITTLSAIFFGYFFGSIMTSELIKGFYKVDPRKHFSKNPGATNAVRTFGATGGAIVLIGDMMKVIVATLIVWGIYQACSYSFNQHDKNNSSWIIYITSLFATIGHALPIFFKFKGGKCVSTFFGSLIIISPWIAMIGMILFILIALAFRYVSFASIVSSFISLVLVFVPGVNFFYLLQNLITISDPSHLVWWATYTDNTCTIVGIGIILLLQWIILFSRHHENIVKLINHNESKIGKLWKRKMKTKNE